MKHVMVVEDNEDNRELLAALLEHRFELSQFEDGLAALDAMAARIPDLVLLDISLPGMSGEQVLARIRDRPETRGIPVVALTAHAMNGDRERYLAQGFDDYYRKPIVDDEAFLDSVDRWSSARRS
jgi:two-component system, cell cycle response regulator DivK